MHELSICQALLTQVDQIARENGAAAVTEINVDVGPLSGVVPQLLSQAFTFAKTNSKAACAELVINESVILLRCQICHHESQAETNALICGQCGDWRTTLIRGDELMLRDIVFEREPNPRTQRTHYV